MRAEWKPSAMPAAGEASGASSSTSSIDSGDERPLAAPHIQAHAYAGARGSVPTRRRRGQATLQTDMAAQAIVATAQAIVFLTQWRKSEADVWARVQPGLVFTVIATGLLIIMRWPRFYWHNRDWLLLLLRLLSLLPPSTRSLGVGTALILEKEPRPGLAGHVVDFLRYATGVRLLPIFFHGFFMLTGPSSCLLTGVVATLLTANSRGYCSTPLLSHPLGRRRLAAVATFLEFGSLPLVALQPTGRHLQPGGALMAGVAPAEPMCRAAVSFAHHFFGLLLPTFLGVHYWQPPEEGSDAADGSVSTAGTAAGAAAGTAGAAQPPSPHKWARCAGWLQRRLRRAAAACDRQLYSLIGPKAQPAVRAVVCWYVLAQCWLLCRLAAGL
ncbi:hypothetical protein C2E21_6080 [Chlorella sorokiniana]|uniref:Uncharacterized protein n=1 Tax=Chlorella sorokiniana TaxID=3076 RepID=A0A2P6TM01_CHLSO|nr:hypothetical protein C2E21_6080 [Chlorella sorokiniana]|eukprot:PRW45363.1 hypothetical protein C2E21_6080 [Chlorella sorokiniana]